MRNCQNSPKPILKLAGQNGLLGSVEAWLAYADAHTDTSHDYSEEKAAKTLEVIGDFLRDATVLYQKLTGNPWV